MKLLLLEDHEFCVALHALYKILRYSATAIIFVGLKLLIDMDLFGLLSLLTASDTYEWLNSPSKCLLTFRNVCPRALWTDIAYPSFITNCFRVDVIEKVY